ncbi:CopD family protein [Sedimenticola hydrogenitrophicus]|uniref:CopD family protein n=1 Tax=Sedimenticola hydrogenitrophicus TaxID=2967975 RepID=UPI0023AFB882|nr:CopD family protein [Sedimenticola hydrogenitrophicus]
MYSIMITLHLLGVVVWVGGMFFAHMALRPAAVEVLEPPQRLPLMKRTLDRFFPWVWLAIVLILGSGYAIQFGILGAGAGLHVHIMQGIGLAMVALFCYIYFLPYRQMGRALQAGELSQAGARLAVMRRIIGINLVLGLVTIVIGAAKPF